MITLRQGKPKTILENSVQSALTAVETYNRPKTTFRMENYISVRPASNSDAKFDTKAQFCIYDEPHNDYLYTAQWVDFIVKLLTVHGFSRENIRSKCKHSLNIDDYK